ncbi:MAG: TonB-dependent receptor [Bacteroidetes bacterium]|nr:TonB-dependent receptor [Bacteroidota bacterium]
MKILYLWFSLLISCNLFAQGHKLHGTVLDENKEALPYASVSLLQPSDSTLAFYGISNTDGFFEIRTISSGNYILQIAYLGKQTLYRTIEIPGLSEQLGVLELKASTVSLKAAQIEAERIPILIKQDTIEYSAASFKTKPDASTEDLLKKLPGLEVDRAGNIKAQGEDVKNVLVDGKEFFSSDPKVATKNLPADAISKVQVYDKKSEEAELSGIQDGERNKTINLLLKEDKKSAWLGDVKAGAGSEMHYQAAAKAYRFTKKSQIALLGMVNDINQFGFSFRDYIDFNGGMRNMMNGDGGMRVTFEDDNSFPINFGQPITGLITSGAGGANYTYEKKTGRRFNISYLGNGSDKKLVEETRTDNFTPDTTFTNFANLKERSNNNGHTLNFSWRNSIDSTQNFIGNGNIGLSEGSTNSASVIQNYAAQNITSNTLLNNYEKVNTLTGKLTTIYLKKRKAKWLLLKLLAEANGSHNLSGKEWQSQFQNYNYVNLFQEAQEQHKTVDRLNYSGTLSATRELPRRWYFVPELKAGAKQEQLMRKQSNSQDKELAIDSLSANFNANYNWMRPGISFKRSNDTKQFKASIQLEAATLKTAMSDNGRTQASFFYFLPGLAWEKEYKPERRLRAFYESFVNSPTANQLLPLSETVNPTQRYSGNRKLKPEYVHHAQVNWIVFDQFSFTSAFAALGGTITSNKINWSRNVDSSFNQVLSLRNVPEDYRLYFNFDFSTPLRAIGMNVNINPQESWNKGMTYVNEIINNNQTFTHELNVRLDNRKKEKWDISLGTNLSYTQAFHSLESKRTDYYSLNYFTELNYSATERLHLSASADITQYHSQTLSQNITVPILKAEVSYFILKAKRGVISLEAFDLLNKNTGISRISEMNYVQQKNANCIGRYFLLSFKYRLTKFENKDEVDVKVNGR